MRTRKSSEGAGDGMVRHVAAVLALSLVLAALLLWITRDALAAGNGIVPAAELSVVCWLLVVAGITGTALASNGNRYGWLVLFGLQPLWITYAFCTGQTGLILGSLAYGAAQLNGLRVSWRKCSESRPERDPATAGVEKSGGRPSGAGPCPAELLESGLDLLCESVKSPSHAQ